MRRVYNIGGMNELMDPHSLADGSGRDRIVECTGIENCDVSDSGISMRGGRDFFMDDVSSVWSEDGISIFQNAVGDMLSYSQGVLTPIEFGFRSSELYLCKVNDAVVASNGVDNIGYIHQGVYTQFPAIGDDIETSDLEAWVNSKYPYAQEFNEDVFAVSTKPGSIMEFFNGCLYIASGNFVYATNRFDPSKMDIRYNVVAGFPDTITMIAAVDDGLYVGTEKAIHFLAGAGITADGTRFISGFSQVLVRKAGVIKGTKVKTEGAYFPQLQGSGDVPIWASPDGIMVGFNGGRCVNLSENKIKIEGKTKGAGIVRCIGGKYFYTVSFEYVAVNVHLGSGFHSNYSAFEFTSFCCVDGMYLGAMGNRAYWLNPDAKTDNGNEIRVNISLRPLALGGSQRSKIDAFYIRGKLASGARFSVEILNHPDGYITTLLTPTSNSPYEYYGTYKVKPPPGLRNFEWLLRISNPGGAWFDINEIEIVANISTLAI